MVLKTIRERLHALRPTLTPYYCEENIWTICAAVADTLKAANARRSPTLLTPPQPQPEGFAVFISTPQRKTWLAYQAAGDRLNSGLVCWDYHVIFVLRCTENAPSNKSWTVFDPDSTLGFGTPLQKYMQLTLRHPCPQRRYRVITAEHYLAHFDSTRTHMLDRHGAFTQPPPSHPPIRAAKDPIPLSTYWDVTRDCWSPTGTASVADLVDRVSRAPQGIVVEEQLLLSLLSQV